MSLKVGTTTAVIVTTEVEIFTYTAIAGDFIRAWYVWGEDDAKLSLKIAGVVQDVGILDVVGNYVDMYKAIPPVPLTVGQAVTIHVTKRVDATSKDFQAVLY